MWDRRQFTGTGLLGRVASALRIVKVRTAESMRHGEVQRLF